MSLDVRLAGLETYANDPLEAWVRLAGIPSPGDQVSVWLSDREGEVFVEVETVTWPAWEYEHDPGAQGPTIHLRRADGLSDEEWRDVFRALNEKRHP